MRRDYLAAIAGGAIGFTVFSAGLRLFFWSSQEDEFNASILIVVLTALPMTGAILTIGGLWVTGKIGSRPRNRSAVSASTAFTAFVTLLVYSTANSTAAGCEPIPLVQLMIFAAFGGVAGLCASQAARLFGKCPGEGVTS